MPGIGVVACVPRSASLPKATGRNGGDSSFGLLTTGLLNVYSGFDSMFIVGSTLIAVTSYLSQLSACSTVGPMAHQEVRPPKDVATSPHNEG